MRAAVEELRAAGRVVIGAALLGGAEKISVAVEPDLPGGPGVSPGEDYGVKDFVAGESPLGALLAGLERLAPDEVVDLSDQPVLDARTRLLLAAHSLARGVPYRGAGFAFEVPPRPRLATKPSIAVIGTGKRTGKTAVAAELARVLVADGRRPVMVAMGRGGPVEPEVVDPATFDLSPEALLALARSGRHAASDHLEDALSSGPALPWPTAGPRSCSSSRVRGRASRPSTPTPPCASWARRGLPIRSSCSGTWALTLCCWPTWW